VEKINEGNRERVYNIEISDKEYLIKNTTYKADMNFDLGFAKKSFNEHFDANITGICMPLFEKKLKRFMSYADSFLIDKNGSKNGILLVSYKYNGLKDRLKTIQDNLLEYKNIVNAKAYIIVNDEFLNYIELKELPPHKANSKEMLSYIKNANKLHKRLKDTRLEIESFENDTTSYTAMYLSVESSIAENINIVYEIILDDAVLNYNLLKLNIAMFFLVFFGMVAFLITIILRKKEIKLTQQDKFVQSSMHEIKTPLSIITLNNELRELEFGRDEYSQEIDSAIKTLKTSYDDMSFTITKDELDYPREVLSLGYVLHERVAYFKSIASSNQKFIELKITTECSVKISKVELIRVIDNNLSNAIKYSSKNSTILVRLDDNELFFKNFGEPIKNHKTIFDKYVRENSIIGGHGLGLSIVKEIATNNNIQIKLTSTLKEGTKFLYIFKCHTSDI
jgi:signal transduction histidine kinase